MAKSASVFALVFWLLSGGIAQPTCLAQTFPKLNSGKVIISGQVHLANNSSKVISLLYSQLAASPTRLSAILDSSGQFQFEFDILQAHEINLRYDKGTAHIFVQPADSLFIELSAADFGQTRYPPFRIWGNHADISRDILAYHQYDTLASFKPALENKTTQAYLMTLKNRMALEDSVLSRFISQHHPTQAFKTWASQDIIYRNANYLVDFEAFHAMHRTPISGVLYDTQLFPIRNTNALVSSWYSYHLWQYALDRYTLGDTLIQNLFKHQQLNEAYRAGLDKLLTLEPPSLSRDLMSYQLLVALSERAPDQFRRLMNQVGRYVSSQSLTSQLQARAQQVEKQPTYPVSLFQPVSGAEREVLGDWMNNLLSIHKGKVIYIDIWATWCGPCRSEVPYAIDLHQYFKGQPIEFVNLCLSSDREAWKQVIKKQKMVGSNYYFNKDQSELLLRKLNVAGFPTYLIIGKDGQVVDRQAPRPSSGSVIKTHLSKLLRYYD